MTKVLTEVSVAAKKYLSFLANFPAPGGGGAHVGIFQAGCKGISAEALMICSHSRNSSAAFIF